MGLATFIGGIHPYEGKELPESKPVQVLTPKDDLVYPMSQHIGALVKSLMTRDDHTLAGQKIGEAGGFISANVIAFVPGTVKAIELRRMANGAMVPSIVVENDGEYKTIEGAGEDRNPFDLSEEKICNAVKEAGIVGLDGAGSPIHVKLTPKDENATEYILVNGVECEPYFTSDHRMMLGEPRKIVGGLKVILQLFDNAKGVIDIENSKPETVKKPTEMVRNEPRITVHPFMTGHPQGGERSLIYVVTSRKANSFTLSADVGCIVDNANTVTSTYVTACKCMPLMRKIIAVTEDMVVDLRNSSAKLGTNYRELLDVAGGFKAESKKVLSGGPMMGQAVFDLNIPVSKISSVPTYFMKDQVAGVEPPVCMRCGKYVSVCPSHIIPVMMMQAAPRDNREIPERLNGMECMECRSCICICPAKRPLVQILREVRKTVAANRRKKGQEGIQVTSKLLNVSSSPYVRSHETTHSIVLDVVIAMLPITAFGVYHFGMHALLVLIATAVACVLDEYVYERLMKKQSIVSDRNIPIAGMILTPNMPPEVSVWIPALGGILAIIAVKQLYGGLGQSFMSPTLAARCFLLTSLAGKVTNLSYNGFDSVSGVTPLAMLKNGQAADVPAVFVGNIPGTIGGISVIALLIGVVYPLTKKVISIWIPGTYILTVVAFAVLFGDRGLDLNYIMARLCGDGLIFGAFFMVADYMTSPVMPKGQITLDILSDVLTGLFGIFGGSVEGVFYIIIISNILVPLTERVILPKALGEEGK